MDVCLTRLSRTKPAEQLQVGKTKLFTNCLCNPTNTYDTEKLKNKLREATND